MLVPAAVLVLLALAAIAVDSAIVFMTQRQAGDVAAAAANDAAGAALSEGAFYKGGAVDIDLARATQVVNDAVVARGTGLDLVGPPSVVVSGRQVCVTVQARVRYLVSPALPGAPRTRLVTARAAATAVEGRGAVATAALC